MKKKWISMAIAFLFTLSITSAPVHAFETETGNIAPIFSDMPSDWSTEALENAVRNGLLDGIKGKILAEKNLTRAQMAAILCRAFGATEAAALSGYTDVTEDEWYYEDMARAVQMRVFVGSADQLNPQNDITREEAFTALARAIKLSCTDRSSLDRFKDCEMVSAWAAGGTAALVSEGYVVGFDGKLNPKETITRAEFAKLMDNILKSYITKPGVYTDDVVGNLMVSASGVILRSMTVSGDLIVGDGVGDGEVTLDGVAVTGRVVVRGGGVNSIRIIGNSNLQNIVIARVNGQVRVYAEDGVEIGEMIVDGEDDVIIEGNAGNVTIEAPDVVVTATAAEISTVVIEGKNSRIVVGNNSNVNHMVVNGEGAAISGGGTVGTVEANADSIVVTTKGTRVTAASGTKGVLAGTLPTDPGQSETVPTDPVWYPVPIVPAGTTPAEYFTFDSETATITAYDITGGLDVTIPRMIDGVTVLHIGSEAFRAESRKRKGSGSDGLTSVLIPDCVLTIGDSAFSGNQLTSLVIPGSVTTIGESAFANNRLDSLVISDGVTNIESDAFGNNLFTEVNIPDSVVVIGGHVFGGCYNLQAVNVGLNNSSYSSTDGVMFNKEKTSLLLYPPARANTTYHIPDGVTSIGDSSFYECTVLTSIVIADSVETIGDYAFYMCTALESVTIPNGVKTIGGRAFFYCETLRGIVIPNSVETIGDGAFEYCYALTSVDIGSGITIISSNTFAWCTSLNSVSIAGGVEEIGAYAFYYCRALLTIEIPNTVKSIGAYAFYNCEALNNLTIPASVENIGNEAFNYCTSLKLVTFVDGGVALGTSAFVGYSNLPDLYRTGGAGFYIYDGSWRLPSSEKMITAFSFQGLNPIVTIDEAARTILVNLPWNWDDIVDTLTASITYTVSASVTVYIDIDIDNPPESETIDFFSPVTYKVTAEDNSWVTYALTVKVDK